MNHTSKKESLREHLAHLRYEDHDGRPVMEFQPDEWAEWVSSHRADRSDEYFCRSGLRSSAFCAYGVH